MTVGEKMGKKKMEVRKERGIDDKSYGKGIGEKGRRRKGKTKGGKGRGRNGRKGNGSREGKDREKERTGIKGKESIEIQGNSGDGREVREGRKENGQKEKKEKLPKCRDFYHIFNFGGS